MCGLMKFIEQSFGRKLTTAEKKAWSCFGCLKSWKNCKNK
jgi:hypothetical protein